jgi:hypothetical protein
MMLAAALLAAAAGPAVAPRPLFRDPVHDGAADASTVHDPQAREWLIFYTNRRADLALADPKDVSWVHGTAIGIARSKDGNRWTYKGVAQIPKSCTVHLTSRDLESWSCGERLDLGSDRVIVYFVHQGDEPGTARIRSGNGTRCCRWRSSRSETAC